MSNETILIVAVLGIGAAIYIQKANAETQRRELAAQVETARIQAAAAAAAAPGGEGEKRKSWQEEAAGWVGGKLAGLFG